jgi:hypothetical protein
MKDMLCINAEQCGDDVVIIHDGDVEINLSTGATLVLKAIVCTGTLRFRSRHSAEDSYLDVLRDVTCYALEMSDSSPMAISIGGSLCLHTALPRDWRADPCRCEESGDAAMFITPPTPQQHILVEGTLTLSPWAVQLPAQLAGQPCPHCCAPIQGDGIYTPFHCPLVPVPDGAAADAVVLNSSERSSVQVRLTGSGFVFEFIKPNGEIAVCVSLATVLNGPSLAMIESPDAMRDLSQALTAWCAQAAHEAQHTNRQSNDAEELPF